MLFAARETAGLLIDGTVLQVLLCDASRADTCLTIGIEDWASRDTVPASWRILTTLLAAPNLPALPDILDRARLHQAKVTTALRDPGARGDHRLHQRPAGSARPGGDRALA